MANPVLSYVNVNQIVGPVTQSSWATFTFAMTQGFQAVIPVEFAMTGDFSYSPEIHVCRSTDGGVTFETAGSVRGVISDDGSAVSRTIRKDVILDTGWYQIRVLAIGAQINTFTIALTTAEIVSAYA